MNAAIRVQAVEDVKYVTSDHLVVEEFKVPVFLGVLVDRAQEHLPSVVIVMRQSNAAKEEEEETIGLPGLQVGQIGDPGQAPGGRQFAPESAYRVEGVVAFVNNC